MDNMKANRKTIRAKLNDAFESGYNSDTASRNTERTHHYTGRMQDQYPAGNTSHTKGYYGVYHGVAAADNGRHEAANRAATPARRGVAPVRGPVGSSGRTDVNNSINIPAKRLPSKTSTDSKLDAAFKQFGELYKPGSAGRQERSSRAGVKHTGKSGKF